MKSLSPLILFVSFLFHSCSAAHEPTKTGLIDSVRCKLYPEQLYAVYVPSSHDGKEKLPVMVLFDPAARAKTTIEQYSMLADSYGVMLACSYNSKNGPLEGNKLAADAMINDLYERFQPDENRLFLSGFSGGSRFAYIYAAQNPKIKGVIACGAFFPGNSSAFKKQAFSYSGIAGTWDFNFSEGLSMQYQLASQASPFQFIVCNGKHEWPPDSVFERALAFQLSKLNDSRYLALKASSLEQKYLRYSLACDDYINAAWILHNLMITDPDRQAEFSDSLNALADSKQFRQQENAFMRSLKLEDSVKSEVTAALQGILLTTYNQYDKHKPFSWWKNELQKISGFEEKPNNLYKQNVGKRIKSYMGVALWESNRRFMHEKFYVQALELADILLLLEPESETYLALKAEVLAAQGKSDEARFYFHQAREKGFTMDNAYLSSSTLLKALNSEFEN